MWRHFTGRAGNGFRIIASALAVLLVSVSQPMLSQAVDIVSGVLESGKFRDKSPLERLRLAAEMTRAKRPVRSELGFVLLDWADKFTREPEDRLQRLQRWAELVNDEKLKHLRIPRDFLNRVLLAEYLVNDTDYLKQSPPGKLELLAKLEKQKLVDWSVYLAYARIYAGGIITGITDYNNLRPADSLRILKQLKNRGLIGWHYKAPTEQLLSAEVLAMDASFRKASPKDRLIKIRALQTSGLISPVTRKEYEKLPVWRLLAGDSAFLKADADDRRKRIKRLEEDNLISGSTASDLIGIFSPAPLPVPEEIKPSAVPKSLSPAGK